jgi:hypothetical protein
MTWTYGDSERLDRVRRRKVRERRLTVGSLVALVLAVGLGGWWLLASSAPAPPAATVTWPSPQKLGARSFAPVVLNKAEQIYLLASVVVRKGQPFTVKIDSDQWTVHGVSEDTDEHSARVRWSPSRVSAVLKLFCRPRLGGWWHIVAGIWPTYQLRVLGVTPLALADGRQQLRANAAAPSELVYLSQHVAVDAHQSTTWDDRVVPLLEAVRSGAGFGGVGGHTALIQGAVPVHRDTLWRLKEGYSAAPRAAGDTATYCEIAFEAMNADDALAVTTRLAQLMAVREPTATLKFVFNGDAHDPSVSFRIALDDKAGRAGWVKHAGETTATPLRWWDGSQPAGVPGVMLTPAAPRIPRRAGSAPR